MAPETQKALWAKALKRGFDPSARPVVILDCHVEDGQRTGRPRKKDQERDEVLELVRSNPDGGEISCQAIADKLENRISASTVRTILNEPGLK